MNSESREVDKTSVFVRSFLLKVYVGECRSQKPAYVVRNGRQITLALEVRASFVSWYKFEFFILSESNKYVRRHGPLSNIRKNCGDILWKYKLTPKIEEVLRDTIYSFEGYCVLRSGKVVNKYNQVQMLLFLLMSLEHH